MASSELCATKYVSGYRSAALAIAIALGAMGIVSATPSDVAAQEVAGGLKDSSPHERPMMISAFTGIGYGHYAGFGFPFLLSGRFYIPIVPDGFIPKINDEFGLEFGLDFNFVFLDSDLYRDSLLFTFGVPAEAMYDFHFSPTFDAYAKVGFLIGAALTSDVDHGVYFQAITAVGLRFQIVEGLLLRAEAGWPWVKVGIGLAL